ncbi:MAG: hypothetical protein EP298_00285, partial [Gammaproteobacteria bacterium]
MTLAIGAIGDDSFGAESGHVKIYQWDGSAWVQIGSDIDGNNSGDLSGFSVALSDDGLRLALGAINDDGGGSNSGQVRVYEYNGSTWGQVGSDLNGLNANNQSGYSVALNEDGTRVAISSIQFDNVETNEGHVVIYNWDGANWVNISGVTGIETNAAGVQGGYSISLSADGNRLAIGAPL